MTHAVVRRVSSSKTCSRKAVASRRPETRRDETERRFGTKFVVSFVEAMLDRMEPEKEKVYSAVVSLRFPRGL